jgi:hypothetical protein
VDQPNGRGTGLPAANNEGMDSIRGAIILRERFDRRPDGGVPADSAAAPVPADAAPIYHWTSVAPSGERAVSAPPSAARGWRDRIRAPKSDT